VTFGNAGAVKRAVRWRNYRFVLNSWRWMLIVYAYDDEADVVAVVTIQDGRASTAASSSR
jgi:hypothetical protein